MEDQEQLAQNALRLVGPVPKTNVGIKIIIIIAIVIINHPPVITIDSWYVYHSQLDGL